MLSDHSFRQRIAEQFKENTNVSRMQVFGHLNEKYLPVNLPDDSEVMFAGYVGSRYRPGGCVVFAINPGGGGDAYTKRIPEDEIFYPTLYALKEAGPAEVEDSFELVNSTFEPIVQRWNLWRILGPTIEAAGYDLNQVAYLNAVPYRTRGDKKPPVHAQREGWNLVTRPNLDMLKPNKIVALGKKVGSVLDKFYDGSAEMYCIPRTIGDSYISDEAEKVLESLRAANGA